MGAKIVPLFEYPFERAFAVLSVNSTLQKANRPGLAGTFFISGFGTDFYAFAPESLACVLGVAIYPENGKPEE